MDLYGRDLITTQDWSIDELIATMKLAEKLKDIRRKGKLPPKVLERKNFFMVFWAPSTRTRGAFEAGMSLLGGHAPYIDAMTSRLRTEEALKDVIQIYEIYGDGIGVRVLNEAIDFIYGKGRRIVEQFAKIAKVPVINMACCTYHPTQAMGDIMTVNNKIGSLRGKKYAIMWAYSSKLRGRCSIQEEVLIATRFGMDVVLAYPPRFDIDPKIVEMAKKNAKDSGGSFQTSHNFKQALNTANVVFPRSWVTSELSEVGATAFGTDNEIMIHNKYKNWRLEQSHVNDLMGKSAIATHVLPVFRGEEVTDEVIDGPNSVIYEQAEDNFYAKMAVLSLTMSKEAML
ncbi:ornithine carbamoyltransferase [Candidatus Bathyarchaeota archaeon]|nr:ornithine carbamoyltransferase [Candidatus Bathyarchaeota archaeon]